RWIKRRERSHFRRVSGGAGDNSDQLRESPNAVVDQELRPAARQEGEGGIEVKRLEQRALVEVGALHHRHPVEITDPESVRQSLRQDRRAGGQQTSAAGFNDALRG